MKILYAASNNQNSRIQLSRFLREVDSSHQIKIAAYKKSSPDGVNIDWTLDALLNIYRPHLFSLDNDNFSIYLQQVKDYAPDLVISDLEYFTSMVARELNLHIWQCSSLMINFALTRKEKYGLGLFKNYAYVVSKESVNTQRLINVIDNSNRNFVYSHYGDTNSPPSIQTNFEWIRPYCQLAKNYVPCQHFITAGLYNNDKRLINLLRKYPDSVIFMERCQEQHRDLHVKDIRIEHEYYCNLKNSNFFACQGQTSFLADAFYNSKYSLIYPNYDDSESVTNSQISQNLNLGSIMTYSADINSVICPDVQPVLSGKIKYLHEHIKEL